MIEMLNMDCMDYMSTLPDNAFDLSIVDPPYGIGEDGHCRTRKKHDNLVKHEKKTWDNESPNEKYFSELFRVSKNQIIWGANYFTQFLPASMGWVYWKKNIGGDFSDGELAFTSFDRALKEFEYWNGNNGVARIHPTQKPVALYKWLLSRYAKPGDRILDTHGGSGSICIACHDLGYDLTWMELDEDYYKAACERYKTHAAQSVLFEPQEIIQKTYNNEFDLTS